MHPLTSVTLFFVLWRVLTTQLLRYYGLYISSPQLEQFDQAALLLIPIFAAGISFLVLPPPHREHVLKGIYGSTNEQTGNNTRRFWVVTLAFFLSGCVVRGLFLWMDWVYGNLPPPTIVPTDSVWLSDLFIAQFLKSLVEEFSWRGVVLSLLLTRFPPLPTLILTGLAFGFWHLLDGQHTFWDGLQIGFHYGLLCGVAFYRTGSLWPAVAMHFSMNLVLYSYPEIRGMGGEAVSISLNLYAGRLLACLLLFGVLYWVGYKSQKERSAVQL